MKPHGDYKFSRSLSERVRGMRDAPLGKVWRSRRERKLQEIEAIESCKWLRAAGFPQYAQMYEEHQFPIEVGSVEKDHDFLDPDELQSLFRRLNTLNKCATMKIEAVPQKSVDDSDDEDPCALSDKWRYQRSSRRWSRKDLDIEVELSSQSQTTPDKLGIRSCSSHDSVITDNEESLTSQQEDSPSTCPRSPHSPTSEPTLSSGHPSPRFSYSESSSYAPVPTSPTAVKRSTSEKLKSARNTFLKRMESLKTRKGSMKGRPRLSVGGKIEIGSPVLVETKSIQERMDKLGCKDISPSASDASPNLSTSSSRMTPLESEIQDSINDDSVFLDTSSNDLPTLEHVSRPRTSSDTCEKRRNYSEPAVHGFLQAPESASNDGIKLTNGYSESSGSGESRFTVRSSSFTLGCSHPDQPPRQDPNHKDDITDTLHESNNNLVEKDIKLRSHRRKGLQTSESRHSVYDNVPLDSESEAVKELDMIVQSLMQDISELNATWGQSVNIDSQFPLALTQEEFLQDSDKDSTLTRNNGLKHDKNKQDSSSSIQFFPLENSNLVPSRSSSSSSSTISHSTSSVNPAPLASSEGLTNSTVTPDHPSRTSSTSDSSHHGCPVLSSSADLACCDNVEASHVHVLGMDETLDTILRDLEAHYGAHKHHSSSDDSTQQQQSTPNGSSQKKIRNTLILSSSRTHDYEEIADADVDSRSGSGELSDPEMTPGSREEDGMEDSCDTTQVRERRDSGVGSSLTREPSDRRRYRIRWHSFVKSHRPSFNSRDLQIDSMSAGQLKLLRKFSLLKVTALMEKYSLNRSGWNWVMPMNKFMRRFKVNTDYKDKKVFGVPLHVILQRTGQPLPQCMLHAMRSLRKNAMDAVGIFRKSGVRSRIQKLRDEIEVDPESVAFESLQAYDVADLLKLYFRELPECLLTTKLSGTFINIFTHVPAEQRQEALYASVMLLPDENREVLQSLLLFLSDMASYSQQNQMNASNLAVCFAPSLFHMCGSRPTPGASPKRNRKKDGIPDQRELQEQKAAHECLTEMIIHSKKIFVVPGDILRMCHFSYMDQCSPVGLDELGQRRQGEDSYANGDYMAYLDCCIQGLLKESRDKFKGWVTVPSNCVIDLSYKKIDDGYSLRLWKCSVEVEAPPYELLNRVCRERQLWDEDLLKSRVVESLDQNTEVYQYVLNSMAPHPTHDFCELRHWRANLPKGACVLVSTSVEHREAPLLGGIRGVVLASRYLIEPCGSGKSRLTHISRVDLRGHTPDWYNKVYGHLCANYMVHIRDSFLQKADGPETNV